MAWDKIFDGFINGTSGIIGNIASGYIQQKSAAKKLYKQAEALREMDRSQEALECYEQAIKISPDFADAWLGRGEALLNLMRFEDAISSCKRSILINPNNQLAYFFMAVCYNLLNEPDLILDALEKGAKLNPVEFRDLLRASNYFSKVVATKRYQRLIA